MREHIKTAIKESARILFPILSIPTRFNRIELSDAAIKEAKLRIEEYSPDSKASCLRAESFAVQNRGGGTSTLLYQHITLKNILRNAWSRFLISKQSIVIEWF